MQQQYPSNDYQQQQQQQQQYMNAPPPQIRSQSLPEFHPPSHFENVPPHMQHQMPSVRMAQQDPSQMQYQQPSHLQPQQQQYQPQSSYPLQSPPSYALQPSPLQALHQPLSYPLQSSPQFNQQQGGNGAGGMIAAPPGLSQGGGLQQNSNSPPFNSSKPQSMSLQQQQQMKEIKQIAGAGNVDDYNRPSQSRMPAPPQPRRAQSLGESLAPPSHEAVSVSLSRSGAQRGDLSRFAAGPPNLETKGFVARCCVEARRGGRQAQGGGTSSVLARMGSGGPRGSESGVGSAFFPVSNPYGQLHSSPELPDSSASPAPYQKPSPLSTTPSLSQNTTPLGSPLRQPRPKMAQPILPPK